MQDVCGTPFDSIAVRNHASLSESGAPTAHPGTFVVLLAPMEAGGGQLKVVGESLRAGWPNLHSRDDTECRM